MGNQLVGIAPSQIYPVEHYLTDHSDLLFDINLGSTRFFKVARARSQEGLIVVKVFVIHDPTLPLSAYKDKLEEIRSKLASAVNCLPFQRMILTEKAGSIMREYVKYSLYDRISTRPFLTSIEKKWVTFQVLYALHQAHKFGVCHGDIKLENIMITSWNWVLLTDFASFKPTYLPEDNPADFSYFFDTSRRRTCYIAPERFVKTLSSELNNTLLLPEQEVKTGDLHPMMDIFSAGCALTELYNEGHPPFDFSQLLAYRNNEYSVSKHLDSIDDSGIRDLLSSMLERNPTNRKSAELYLSQARGIIFPEYFYSFLQSYMLIFSAAPILSPDEKINRLKKDIGNIISILRAEENERMKTSMTKAAETIKAGQCESNVESIRDDSGHSEENTMVEVDSDQSFDKNDLNQIDARNTGQDIESDVQVETEPEFKSSEEDRKQVCDAESEKPVAMLTEILEGLVIVTQLVTSCIRGLHHSQSKLHSLEILLELAENVSDETILDRILPYIFLLVHDPAPRVRVSAIHTLTKCLHLVKSIPPSDVNIFPEYILPGLSQITQDEAVIVRAAYAENIAHLAHIALRYLENAHLSNLGNKEGPKPSYDSELQTLHEMVQQSVSMLLTDSQNLVKQTLMENGINKLCVFFGKQKANDILLSHVITFLNDKEDKELRGSFFECIVGVAAYVGWHSSPILLPLLQQGLTDPEEFVIAKAINAMATLTELGLLHKSALYQLLGETMVFLVHPNLWILHATVGFISAAARTLNVVDVQCKVQTMIQPYLKHPLIQIEKEILLLEALVSPIPRIVYDSVVRYNDVEELFQVLEQRQAIRTKAVTGIMPQYNTMSTSLRNLFRRLSSESMTEAVEDQLLMMRLHLAKINKYRNSADTKQNTAKPADGKLELNAIKDRIRHHIVMLYPDAKTDLSLPPFKRSDRRTSDSVGTYATMNQEWRTMFAAQDSSQHAIVRMSDMTGSSGSPSQSIHSGDIHLSPQHCLPDMASINSFMNDHSLHERSYIQYRCAPCRLEVRQLTCRKQEQHAAALRAQHWANVAWESGSKRLLPNDWRPRGIPVAHLHEHRAAVNRLVSIVDTSLFASSSSDGCIKIWDASKMEGRNIANRSRQTYMHRGGPLVGLTMCDQGQSLASSASQSGTVFVVRIEPNSSKMSVIGTRQLDIQEEGCAVDLQYLDSGSQSVLVYASLYGSLVGWDLRCPGTTWRLENDLKHGVITSFCVNSHQQWLTLGTSSGMHTCWDLRFQLPITKIKHRNGHRVRKVVTHPTEPSWIISAVQGNNEISIWDLETHHQQLVLWASKTPALTNNQDGNSVCALYAGCIDCSGFLLAGGTDMKLRFWDLKMPTASYIALPAANDVVRRLNSSKYEQRVIDGSNVVVELLVGDDSTPSFSGASRNMEESGPETPPSGHHDTISAVAMTNTYILTGSTDGLIQVWK
ncbi:phosphoinositide 3-kinase regulatory subunit 4 isoform X1 [Harpegnathos saltator]|uniref:non-specific serine/threonine protein kinase n=2 Tax=Harpegnathos saltator TaxID=610380 RepID=E2BB70_HARSA|nr:phosphoinositide 3-kinase regulatory subunit 4 isoform X1 [Harpegnathos saltator]EFN87043.1 Phosphoinositide 3-kinase regulatory subunit 4 [Harpegnathos saltator]